MHSYNGSVRTPQAENYIGTIYRPGEGYGFVNDVKRETGLFWKEIKTVKG